MLSLSNEVSFPAWKTNFQLKYNSLIEVRSMFGFVPALTQLSEKEDPALCCLIPLLSVDNLVYLQVRNEMMLRIVRNERHQRCEQHR